MNFAHILGREVALRGVRPETPTADSPPARLPGLLAQLAIPDPGALYALPGRSLGPERLRRFGQTVVEPQLQNPHDPRGAAPIHRVVGREELHNYRPRSGRLARLVHGPQAPGHRRQVRVGLVSASERLLAVRVPAERLQPELDQFRAIAAPAGNRRAQGRPEHHPEVPQPPAGEGLAGGRVLRGVQVRVLPERGLERPDQLLPEPAVLPGERGVRARDRVHAAHHREQGQFHQA